MSAAYVRNRCRRTVIAFSIANALVLNVRIGAENTALGYT
jgi:isoprenylcysteine carboxyl methyltransferase (ICMT) family protein YpbQ